MEEDSTRTERTPKGGGGPGSWSDHYGERHRLVRITAFPQGVRPARRVRIYYRLDHYILQWWDRAAKRNLCERIEGDLVTAIGRARQIDERLEHFRSAGVGVRKPPHDLVVERFLVDLRSRADAGEVDPGTVRRYGAALRYYQEFVDQPEIARRYSSAGSVNRDFALAFQSHLQTTRVSPNGRANNEPRPMRCQDYVLDVVRSMYQWAADPDRGNLMPEGFRNPFLRHGRRTCAAALSPIGEPDIEMAMAVDFLRACDAYQLRLFGPLIVYGLRAAEPCYLFHEHFDREWLRVPCLPELHYLTKGRREKHLPMIPGIAALLGTAGTARGRSLGSGDDNSSMSISLSSGSV